MGAVQAIVKSETPMTVMQLATITGADELLIGMTLLVILLC